MRNATFLDSHFPLLMKFPVCLILLSLYIFAFIPLTVKADCVSDAEDIFELPPKLLVAVLNVEGGRIGQEVLNRNQTYDIGPMQINSTWLPILKEFEITRQQLRDDYCINVAVGAWILANELTRLPKSPRPEEIWEAVGRYHSRNPKHNRTYAQKIWRVIHRE